MFEKGIAFYEHLEDPDGLKLLQQCIVLRLCDSGRNAVTDRKTPRFKLLGHYRDLWQWDDARIRQLADYAGWSEARRLEFETRVMQKIAFLYELLLKGQPSAGVSIDMTDRDLTVLKNRIDACFSSKPGKIQRCSAQLLKKPGISQFRISGGDDPPGDERLSVYGHVGGQPLERETPLFSGKSLLETAGWFLSNGLYRPSETRIDIQSKGVPRHPAQGVRKVLTVAHRFLSPETVPIETYEMNPCWEKCLILLYPHSPGTSKRVGKANWLMANNWREFFSGTMDMTRIESNTHACYKISEYLWELMQTACADGLSYRIIRASGHLDPDISAAVSDHIDQFEKNRSDKGRLKPETDERHPADPDLPLLLDK
ncbi:MAG: class I adenylate cyclase [Deltaproteobacteria bacterium]|nr:class I adenylate cyclase [Deltaproteobacteria bacterium]